MLVTLLGIVTEVRPMHPKKALPPMPVTFSGIVIVVKEMHLSKAQAPMVVTLLGMITELSLLQHEKE